MGTGVLDIEAVEVQHVFIPVQWTCLLEILERTDWAT
jgi:hypothetical protein